MLTLRMLPQLAGFWGSVGLSFGIVALLVRWADGRAERDGGVSVLTAQAAGMCEEPPDCPYRPIYRWYALAVNLVAAVFLGVAAFQARPPELGYVLLLVWGVLVGFSIWEFLAKDKLSSGSISRRLAPAWATATAWVMAIVAGLAELACRLVTWG